MDTSKISTGELVAGIAGLALFLFLFLDWLGPASGWQLFDITDILLALIGLGVAALVAARAAGQDIGVPGGPALVIALAGFAATVITLTFLLEGDERKIGLFLAFIASIAITYGGWDGLRSRRGGTPARTPASSPPPAA